VDEVRNIASKIYEVFGESVRLEITPILGGMARLGNLASEMHRLDWSSTVFCEVVSLRFLS
jgi:hypothetical protein